jgi:RHS repeat-associated protein
VGFLGYTRHQEWCFEYNPIGKVIRSTDPLGRTTVYAYAPNGIDLLEVRRIRGQETDLIESRTYNSQHRPLTVTDARGATTSYTYNDAGQILTVAAPPAQGHTQGLSIAVTYDTSGYLTQVSGPAPGANTSFTYDDYGRRRTVTDPAGLTLTYDHDALDRVTKVTYPDGTYQETTYNRLDAGKRRDRLGRWTESFYDALRHRVGTKDAAGGTTQYYHGTAGCASCGCSDKLVKLIDANGNATSWDYDLQGRVTQETRADGSSESYVYETTTSRLKQKADRKGVTTDFEYFLDNRLSRKSYSDSTVAVSYTYDPANGLILTAANGTDILTWTYDNKDRVVAETSTNNVSTVGYTYDDAGNRVALTLDGTTHLAYGHDQQSRLTDIIRGPQTFGLGYDTASRRTSLAYPNGVVTSYGYDTESRLTSLGASLGSTPITSFGYVYDAVGNRTRKTTLDWAEDYRYDTVDQLASVDRSTGTPSRWRFTNDPVGNRTGDQTDDAAMQASFNNVNELLSRQAGGALTFKGATNEPAAVTVAGGQARTAADNSFTAQAPAPSGTSNVVVAATDPSGNTRTNTYQVSAAGAGAIYTYDSNGNLATKAEGTDSWTYSWNAENQLTRVEKNGAEVARFAYDPLGRRVEKAAGGIATRYTYDGDAILREVRGTSTLKYVHGRRIDEPLAVDNGTALVYFHADALGSVAKATNESGAVTLTRQFDAWGNLQAGIDDPGYAFTGREWDPETRLYFYRARYYDPEVGAFLSEDPLRYDSRTELYRYVKGNPAKYVDPYGWFADHNLPPGRPLCRQFGGCPPPPPPVDPKQWAECVYRCWDAGTPPGADWVCLVAFPAGAIVPAAGIGCGVAGVILWEYCYYHCWIDPCVY